MWSICCNSSLTQTVSIDLRLEQCFHTYPEKTQHVWSLPLYDPQPSPSRRLKPADKSAVRPKGIMRIANKKATKTFTAIYSCWKLLCFLDFRYTRAQLSSSKSCRKCQVSLPLPFSAAFLEPNRASPLTRNIFNCAEQKTQNNEPKFTIDLSVLQCFLDYRKRKCCLWNSLSCLCRVSDL